MRAVYSHSEAFLNVYFSIVKHSQTEKKSERDIFFVNHKNQHVFENIKHPGIVVYYFFE